VKSGLYWIRNLWDGKRYVGLSIDVSRRLRAHRSLLERGIHDNIHLQRAWNRDGAESFVFECVRQVVKRNLREREQKLLDRVVGKAKYYNINPLADVPPDRTGQKMPREAARRVAAKLRGKPKSAAHKRALSEARKKLWREGKYDFHIPTLQKNAGNMKGKKQPPFSAEHRQKIADAVRKRAQRRNSTTGRYVSVKGQ